jgi:hypothetical protein
VHSYIMLHLMLSAKSSFIQLTGHLSRDQMEQVRAALARHHGVPQPDTDLVAYSFASPRGFNHAMLALHLLRLR